MSLINLLNVQNTIFVRLNT